MDPAGTGTTDPTADVAHTYDEGTGVLITATPASGYAFDHWSGDLTGSTNPDTVTMDTDKAVTAHFIEVEYHTLTVHIVGNGSVSLTPPGGSYPSGTGVTLDTIPDAGWHFDGWSDDLGGDADPATITMDSNKTVTATFVQDTYTLTVNVVGNGSVSLTPPGGSYLSDTGVDVRAIADSGRRFD